jgi:hypothetical protein
MKRINNLILIKNIVDNKITSDKLMEECDNVILNQLCYLPDIYYWLNNKNRELTKEESEKIKNLLTNKNIVPREKVLLENLINKSQQKNNIVKQDININNDTLKLECENIIDEYVLMKSIDDIKEQVLEALRKTIASELLPSYKPDKLKLLLADYSGVDLISVLLSLSQQNQSKDFPFLFTWFHYNTEQAISLIQKKWSFVFIQVFDIWLEIFRKIPLPMPESAKIFLFRIMMALQQKKINQAQAIHVKIFLKALQLNAITDNDIFAILTQMKDHAIMQILLQQELFYWLSTNIKEHHSFSRLLENLDPVINKKWQDKINRFERVTLEKTSSFEVNKKELSLIYQDEFLYTRIQSSVVPDEILFWLDTGIINSITEKKIKNILLELPIIFFLKERYVHQQAILKIAEWVNSTELNRQFQLLLKANIKSADVSNYFQQLLSVFFDKADKQATKQFLLHFHELIQQNSSWNKSVFWEQLLEKTAHLSFMEKALIQTVATGKMIKHSKSLKKILKWHLVRTTKKTLTPLVILEKYVIGDFQDLINSNLSAKDIKKSIKVLWFSSNKNFPYLVYKLGSHELYRKHFIELMQEFGEKPILDRIHPKLMTDWSIMEKIIYRQSGISVQQ